MRHPNDRSPKAPLRCALNGKVIYAFQFDAETAAVERARHAGIELAAYKDPTCEHWHITKNTESY